MIFVILGTQDKTFPRLIEKIENQIKKKNIKEEVIVQAGQTKYESDLVKVMDFVDVDEFNKLIDESSFIITHSGVGSILTALEKGKSIIAVPRLKKYGEHVNDHQLQILENFAENKYVIPVKDLEDENELEEALKKVKTFKPNKFKSNKESFLDSLREEINKDFIS